MLDRTDLVLMLCDYIMEMGTDELCELLSHVAGEDFEVCDPEEDLVTGPSESLELSSPDGLKTWLGFMLYALGERVECDTGATATKQDDAEDVKRRLLAKVLDSWNEEASGAAIDALRDLVADLPDVAKELMKVVWDWSDYWPEQIARSAYHLPSDDTGDLAFVLQEITEKEASV